MHHLAGQRHKHERRHSDAEHPNKEYLKFLDKVTFVAGVIGPFTVLPQIWSIFSTHSASGVSLETWSLIFIVTFPWILYGVAHKDKSIITSFILWELANASVVVGVLLYG